MKLVNRLMFFEDTSFLIIYSNFILFWIVDSTITHEYRLSYAEKYCILQ